MKKLDPTQKIDIQENDISFKVVFGFGERTFESNFKGRLDENKITGEMTGFRNTIQKVTGKKIVASN